jgi:hypothetical protein
LILWAKQRCRVNPFALPASSGFSEDVRLTPAEPKPLLARFALKQTQRLAMQLTAIYAQIACSDLDASLGWYTSLFGRAPDAQPMRGLAEWHHGKNAGLQLFQNPQNAGHTTLTLIVPAIHAEHQRLSEHGLQPGPIEHADYTTITRLADPDSNLVVLAQPGRVSG